jgi:hypothetical protein
MQKDQSHAPLPSFVLKDTERERFRNGVVRDVNVGRRPPPANLDFGHDSWFCIFTT